MTAALIFFSSLSIYLSLPLSLSFSLSIYLSIYPSDCVCLPVCLSLYLSIYLSIYLSFYLSIYLSISPSVCVCLSVSISLSLLPSLTQPRSPLSSFPPNIARLITRYTIVFPVMLHTALTWEMNAKTKTCEHYEWMGLLSLANSPTFLNGLMG